MDAKMQILRRTNDEARAGDAESRTRAGRERRTDALDFADDAAARLEAPIPSSRAREIVPPARAPLGRDKRTRRASVLDKISILLTRTKCAFWLVGGDARQDLKVDLPAMYATGKDAKSVKFNCIQRGHQQALETFTSFVLTSLVGGVSYPVSVALFGLVYMKARIAWADGYATGDPKNRYSNKWAVFIWTTQMGCILAAGAVALQVAGVM